MIKILQGRTLIKLFTILEINIGLQSNRYPKQSYSVQSWMSVRSHSFKAGERRNFNMKCVGLNTTCSMYRLVKWQFDNSFDFLCVTQYLTRKKQSKTAASARPQWRQRIQSWCDLYCAALPGRATGRMLTNEWTNQLTYQLTTNHQIRPITRPPSGCTTNGDRRTISLQ